MRESVVRLFFVNLAAYCDFEGTLRVLGDLASVTREQGPTTEVELVVSSVLLQNGGRVVLAIDGDADHGEILPGGEHGLRDLFLLGQDTRTYRRAAGEHEADQMWPSQEVFSAEWLGILIGEREL